MEDFDEDLLLRCVGIVVGSMMCFIMLHHFFPLFATAILVLIPAVFIVFYDYQPQKHINNSKKT